MDGLHQKAGSSNVVDLHGRIDTVTCVTCGLKFSREYIQNLLIEKNPKFAEITGKILPDGDAKIDNVNYQSFNIYKPNKLSFTTPLKSFIFFYG